MNSIGWPLNPGLLGLVFLFVVMCTKKNCIFSLHARKKRLTRWDSLALNILVDTKILSLLYISINQFIKMFKVTCCATKIYFIFSSQRPEILVSGLHSEDSSHCSVSRNIRHLGIDTLGTLASINLALLALIFFTGYNSGHFALLFEIRLGFWLD